MGGWGIYKVVVRKDFTDKRTFVYKTEGSELFRYLEKEYLREE